MSATRQTGEKLALVTNISKATPRRVVGLGLALASGVAAVSANVPAISSTPSKLEFHLAKPKPQAGFREPVAFEGSTNPAQAGQQVRLEYAPKDRGFGVIDTAAIDGSGHYRLIARADQTGTFRAVSEDGGTSPQQTVGVEAPVSTNTAHEQVSGNPAPVSGTVGPGKAGRTVQLQVSEPQGWKPVGEAQTGQGGDFNVSWRPPDVGSYELRVVFPGDDQNAPTAAAVPGSVDVYRPTEASWYQLPNSRTACGQTMDSNTVGVANKSLPCGTPVTLSYNGRKITVPVIDRGPFVAGRTWDLTYGAKQQLGLDSTGTVLSNR